MKHKTLITPLNCAFGVGLNSILRMEESEYIADTVRSIYCKSPDLSWFKMKSGSASTPYLEPGIYGLKPGDIITVEFDALLLSGQGGLTVNFNNLLSNYTIANVFGEELPDNSLSSNFKHFKVSFMMRDVFANGIGVVINLRPTGTSNEIIVKNVEIDVETSNNEFSLMNNITSFVTKTDYMKCIDFFSGTNLVPNYNALLTLNTSGKVLFPDDYTLQFSNAGTTSFKGLMTLFNGHKYRACFAVYAEYISPQTPLSVTSKSVTEAGTLVADDGGGTSMPLTTVSKKAIRYFISPATVTRKTFIDIGMVASGSELTLKNVRFSMPQFDDGVKRIPNQLEELYTNLSAKLR